MNLAVAIIGYRRPWYMRQTLEALDAAMQQAGISSVPISISINPAPYLRHVQVRRVAMDFDVRPYMHEQNIGLNANAFFTIERAMSDPAVDYVLFLDDDVVISRDAIRYHLWAMEKYAEDQRILNIASFRHCLGWLPRPMKPGDHKWVQRDMRPGEMYEVCTNAFFDVYGWGMWRDRWDGVRKGFPREGDTWDKYVEKYRGEHGLMEICPMISRSIHIGEIDRTHVGELVPSFWAANEGNGDFVDISEVIP